MTRALDPVSLGTCRRLLISLVLMAIWARALSPDAVWAGIALIASGCSILVTLIAAFRREPRFGPVLNHWDEALALIGVQCFASIMVSIVIEG